MQQITKDEQQNEDIAEIVTDPVCGMTKPKSNMKFSSEFLGKTYYFDTETDKDIFDARPDYWIPEEEREKARLHHKVI